MRVLPEHPDEGHLGGPAEHGPGQHVDAELGDHLVDRSRSPCEGRAPRLERLGAVSQQHAAPVQDRHVLEDPVEAHR